ncbi:MAG: MBL fold metallo-hydrolase [Actinobacteria bacterium]|nr:MBL fold metallo-hydrolase [Actinomycetota bacterium]
MSTPNITTAESLLPLLGTAHSPFLLDVREPDEFADWVIPGAVNIPLGQLEARLAEVPSDRGIVVICAKGARAHSGAAMLAVRGITASVMDGGMSAWATTYDSVEVTLAAATVIQLRRRGKGCLSYLIGAGTAAAVIDPSTDIDRYTSLASHHGFRITHVFDTHLHADHVSGGRALAEATGATLVLNPADTFHYPYTPLTDGLSVELEHNVHLTVEAVSAPGHTQGSTVYRLGDAALFTGDTLFLESVGRPDLADQAEEFAHALYATLHTRILTLADDILIFPAHWGDAVPVTFGELVTARLGDLRPVLPALAYSEEDFVNWALTHVKDRPPNYIEIVKFNAGMSTLSAEEISEMELGPNRCAIA